MSEDTERELTPTTFRAMMTESEKKAGKVAAAMKGVAQREFWEAAMVHHLELRKKQEKEGSFSRQEFYLHVPRDAESLALYGDEGYVAEVIEWAKKDDVKTRTALYTAIRRYLDEALSDVGFSLDEME